MTRIGRILKGWNCCGKPSKRWRGTPKEWHGLALPPDEVQFHPSGVSLFWPGSAFYNHATPSGLGVAARQSIAIERDLAWKSKADPSEWARLRGGRAVEPWPLPDGDALVGGASAGRSELQQIDARGQGGDVEREAVAAGGGGQRAAREVEQADLERAGALHLEAVVGGVGPEGQGRRGSAAGEPGGPGAGADRLAGQDQVRQAEVSSLADVGAQVGLGELGDLELLAAGGLEIAAYLVPYDDTKW